MACELRIMCIVHKVVTQVVMIRYDHLRMVLPPQPVTKGEVFGVSQVRKPWVMFVPFKQVLACHFRQCVGVCYACESMQV